jgi:hypothetical protein
VANMFIDLGNRVAMSDEDFKAEMEKRVAEHPGQDIYLGCPLCGVIAKQEAKERQSQNQQQ